MLDSCSFTHKNLLLSARLALNIRMLLVSIKVQTIRTGKGIQYTI